jgi:hypothetical protein
MWEFYNQLRDSLLFKRTVLHGVNFVPPPPSKWNPRVVEIWQIQLILNSYDTNSFTSYYILPSWIQIISINPPFFIPLSGEMLFTYIFRITRIQCRSVGVLLNYLIRPLKLDATFYVGAQVCVYTRQHIIYIYSISVKWHFSTLNSIITEVIYISVSISLTKLIFAWILSMLYLVFCFSGWYLVDHKLKAIWSWRFLKQ